MHIKIELPNQSSKFIYFFSFSIFLKKFGGLTFWLKFEFKNSSNILYRVDLLTVTLSLSLHFLLCFPFPYSQRLYIHTYTYILYVCIMYNVVTVSLTITNTKKPPKLPAKIKATVTILIYPAKNLHFLTSISFPLICKMHINWYYFCILLI